MPIEITDVSVKDVRFPTSLELDGSDAMNEAPDYSCAYVVIKTNSEHSGHGMTFTCGRGTEICVTAVEALKPMLVGKTLESFTENMGAFWNYICGDDQLRWIGPDKGAIHLATAAVVNAVWDLWGRVEGKPLWKLICDMTAEEFVKCIPFRYVTDALTPKEALQILKKQEATKAERVAQLEREGIPAYTTSAGWLGYDDEKLRRLCRESRAKGWSVFKLKVGKDIEQDKYRARIMREEIGYDCRFMVDANQVWEVEEAIENMRQLAEFKPWFIEEPTSPDDVLGHARIARELAPLGIGVATGEHGMNRIFFKQLLQANGIAVCQPDSCRLGGVNEVLCVLLLCAKFGIPVCPHAGGVGLCEHIQHLVAIDYIALTADQTDRYAEFVDHLHEHFTDPVRMKDGSYVLPDKPGYSTQMKEDTIAPYIFPGGSYWKNE